MPSFRVIDLRPTAIHNGEIIVEGYMKPEQAVEQALGFPVYRSGRKADLVARVYFQHADQPVSMVRFYTKLSDRDDGTNGPV